MTWVFGPAVFLPQFPLRLLLPGASLLMTFTVSNSPAFATALPLQVAAEIFPAHGVAA